MARTRSLDLLRRVNSNGFSGLFSISTGKREIAKAIRNLRGEKTVVSGDWSKFRAYATILEMNSFVGVSTVSCVTYAMKVSLSAVALMPSSISVKLTTNILVWPLAHFGFYILLRRNRFFLMGHSEWPGIYVL